VASGEPGELEDLVIAAAEDLADEDAVRILVVDDRPGNRLVMVEILKELGHPIVTASSGTEALRVLMHQDFAVILLDVNMPGIDGFEVSKLIRERERSAQTPIIFVTAVNVGEASVKHGYALGAVDYVSTPVVPEILRAKVSVFVELQRKTRQLEHTARRLEEEVARTSAEVQKFAYAASHDLRAPLRAIDTLSGWIEKDLDATLPPETREQMCLLRRRVRRLDRLITDLTEFARAGHGEPKLEVVDVGALLGDVIELVQPPEGFVIDADLQVTPFETATYPLKGVLMNLLGNAIKHHDRPGGRVEVKGRDAGDRWEFVVSDDGPGIPSQFHARVFEMFQTLSPRDSVEGSGMGLALVKKLVEGAGGSVSLDSVDRGSTFRFTWPKQWRRRPRSGSDLA
jgi:signal transduction histidine kinase